MDSESYRTGFLDALDVVIAIVRDGGDAFAEVFELATKVRLERAGEVLGDIYGF